MGFDVDELNSGIPVEVPEFNYGGYMIHVTFNLAAFTKDLADWMDSPEASKRWSTAEWVERVVIRWDITSKGVPIPITRKAIEEHKLPESLLNMIHSEVRAAASLPNLKRAWSTGLPSA